MSKRSPDQRSPAAQAWRRLYKTARWRKLREHQLAETPLCERCMRSGLVVAAGVVNHRTPHKGDLGLFTDPENLESLCKACHDGAVQSMEKTGLDYDIAVGIDGFPLDKNHPWWR